MSLFKELRRNVFRTSVAQAVLPFLEGIGKAPQQLAAVNLKVTRPEKNSGSIKFTED